MSESKKIKVSDYQDVMPTFITQVVNSGILNGVVNVKFATARWTPNPTPDDPGNVDPDLVITCDLRMDLYAAQQLRDVLDGLIEKNTKPSGTREH